MWVATLSVVLSVLSLLAGVQAARAADGVWSELAPPDYRLSASAVYDRTHRRMILFGGLNGLEERNDVWVLELAYPNLWRRLLPTGTPPSPRREHTAIYDPVHDRMIIFGGGVYNGSAWVLSNEVWALELSGEAHWTQITPTGTPPVARRASVAVYDAFRNRMLVQGGALSNGSTIGDTWALSLGTTPAWTQLAVTTALGPRAYACAILDSLRDRMVLMGGILDNFSLSDTWTVPLTGAGWTELTTIGSPPFTLGPAGVYDPLHDQMVVIGGFDTNTQTYLQGAWRLRFDTATPTWTRGPLSGPIPPPGIASTAIYDPVADAVRIFGGWGGHPSTVSQDTWTLWLHPSPNWGTPLPSNAPTATGRQGPAAAYDPVGHRMIVFGGQRSWYPIGTEDLNDVWVLNLGTSPTWTPMTPTGTPPAGRSFASLVYDPSGNRVILYGGEDSNGSRFPDVWSLSLTGTPAWTELTPSGTPPDGRSRHGAIYDPIRDRMVMFGGSSLVFPYYQADAWALSLSGAPAWTHLSPAGTAPLRRQGLSVVLDSARDRMLMFGGVSDLPPILNNDVWALNLAGATAWDSLEVAVGPSARRQQVAGYDPARDRLLMFGGYADQGGGPLQSNDLWALSLAGSPAWTELHPPGPPDPDAECAAVFDIAGDRFIKYGGFGGQNGTWIYYPGAVLDASLPPPPHAGAWITAAPNPSRGAVELSFVLPQAGRARLRVFDVTGRQVAQVIDQALPAGRHTVHWDGTIAARGAPAGVYLGRLECPGGVATTRVLLIR
jgi:hypothetical protein